MHGRITGWILGIHICWLLSIEQGIIDLLFVEIDCKDKRSGGGASLIAVGISSFLQQKLCRLHMATSDSPVNWLPIDRDLLNVASLFQEILEDADAVVVRCQMNGRDLSIFGGVGGNIKLLNEVPDQLQVSVLDSCEERCISFLVLDLVVDFVCLDQVTHDLDIALGSREVSRGLAFGFLEVVDHTPEVDELCVDRVRLAGDIFGQ